MVKWATLQHERTDVVVTYEELHILYSLLRAHGGPGYHQFLDLANRLEGGILQIENRVGLQRPSPPMRRNEASPKRLRRIFRRR